MTAEASSPARYRWTVAARALAAIPLNYLLTSIVVGLLARHLPLNPVEASAAATLASFAIFAVIAMAVFQARSAGRAWLWMAGATLVLGGLLALSIHLGGRL